MVNQFAAGRFLASCITNIGENKGYTCSPCSRIDANYHSAVWTERTAVTPKNTGASLREIMKEINLFRNTAPSEEEVKGSQKYESGRFVLLYSNPYGVITPLALVDLHGLDASCLTNCFVKNLMAVTPGHMQSLTQTYPIS